MSLVHFLEAEDAPEYHTPVSAEKPLPVDIGGATVNVSNLNVDITDLATNAKQDTQITYLGRLGNSTYETVAASQTAQVLGATGATGDWLKHLIVVPASVSPGVVTILDNATSINVFAGGTNSLTELKPFIIEIGMKSASGAWKVTTGANVSVIGVGTFT